MNAINNNTAERLRDCIATWKSWDAGLTSTPLPIWQYGGYSNETFLVTDNHKRLVLRLNGEAKRFGVDRELEATILSGLASQPWAPELIHRDPSLDFMVTEYIKGTGLIANEVARHLSSIGRLFTEIHRLEPGIDARLNPVDQAVWYRDQLADDTPAPVLRCYEAILSRAPAVIPEYHLCHHDLLPENILDTPSGLVVLDWEYANLGDPAFDLAVFIEGCQLNDAARHALLDAYQGPASIEFIDYYCDLYRLIEVLWWLLKDPGEPAILRKVERLQQRLAS